MVIRACFGDKCSWVRIPPTILKCVAKCEVWLVCVIIALSSSGRTLPFEGSDGGSNPSEATTVSMVILGSSRIIITMGEVSYNLFAPPVFKQKRYGHQ